MRQVAGATRRKVPEHNLGRGCRNSRRALELIEATAVRGVWDAPMKMFLGSVCAAAVVAGAVAATAQTGVVSSRQPVQAESGVNRVSKADRLPSRNTIVVKTMSITAATDHEQAMASQHLDGCEFCGQPPCGFGSQPTPAALCVLGTKRSARIRPNPPQVGADGHPPGKPYRLVVLHLLICRKCTAA